MKVKDMNVEISDEQMKTFVSQIGSALNNFINEMMPVIDTLINTPSSANQDQIKMVTSVEDTEIFCMLPSKDEKFEDLL